MKQVETEEATYIITVKEVASSEEVFSNIIANGAAAGFGVREEENGKHSSYKDQSNINYLFHTLSPISFISMTYFLGFWVSPMIFIIL